MKKVFIKTQVNPIFFDCIQEGMLQVVQTGTARWYGQIDSINVCGKTGTVQNVGKNHAIFIAFAPMEDPEIAIAVVVENSGYGSTFAVPIASLMIEKISKR
ncbi:MAG: penicillin-binding transpeptidase domain-containing protein [Bacteroidales bacterium]